MSTAEQRSERLDQIRAEFSSSLEFPLFVSVSGWSSDKSRQVHRYSAIFLPVTILRSRAPGTRKWKGSLFSILEVRPKQNLMFWFWHRLSVYELLVGEQVSEPPTHEGKVHPLLPFVFRKRRLNINYNTMIVVISQFGCHKEHWYFTHVSDQLHPPGQVLTPPSDTATWKVRQSIKF